MIRETFRNRSITMGDINIVNIEILLLLVFIVFFFKQKTAYEI